MLNPFKKIKELEKENDKLRAEIAENDPKKILERIIGKDLEWYDYTKLSNLDWQIYYQEAHNILQSPVFTSEINKIV